MKKLILSLFILIGLISEGSGQIIASFPKEPDKFFRALDEFMNAGKREDCKAAADAFMANVKKGVYTPEQTTKIIEGANFMAGRNMTAHPHFLAYLEALNAFSKSGRPVDEFENWLNTIRPAIEAQKKGNNSDFLEYMRFSSGFFGFNDLIHSDSKTWHVESTAYKLMMESGRPRLIFPQTRITGYINKDTVTIGRTQGDFFPMDAEWRGKGGMVTWERAGLDAYKVFAYLEQYRINVNSYQYQADSVKFYNKEFFDKPILGKFIDKITVSQDSNRSYYPRFESYDRNIVIKEIAPYVSYAGAFYLYGNKVLGFSAGERAELRFFARDNKTMAMAARSDYFIIKKGEELSAEKAEIAIYFKGDSIFHPQLNMLYKVKDRSLRLLRGETGIGKSMFTDSYHNYTFQTDAVYWNVDSPKIGLRILSGAGVKPAEFESVNYFSKDQFSKMQGLADYEPLMALKLMADKLQTRTFTASEYAKRLGPTLSEQQIKSLLYMLVENGFIRYDEPRGLISVNDKAYNFVLANAKKIDYDIIKIKSASQKAIDEIDLNNLNVDLKGVKAVPISDTANVAIVPKDNALSLKKDRNMEFDGLVYAGRMDLFGEKMKFNYAPFTIDLDKIDSMRIHIPDYEKLDENGKPMLLRLLSKVEKITGVLEVDAPINKSGRARLPQFPKLTNSQKSYVYYQEPEIGRNAYKKADFFFELEPFKLDSLNTFTPEIINWKGKLVSAGIFPDIPERIKIQPDLSLGFETETPPAGLPLYKAKGNYAGKIKLDYQGLSGVGAVKQSTASFTVPEAHFYPDSMLAEADSFHIDKTYEGVKTPEVNGKNVLINWLTRGDSMYVKMSDQPFTMYEGLTTLKGNLLLTGKGLFGEGSLDWDEASLSSKSFKFYTEKLEADTAELKIKAIEGDKVAFNTPNVNAKFDFKERIGNFKSNIANIPTDFSYNQYRTAINEFKWDIDAKILDFKAPPAGKGEWFISTRADQKGLQFLGKRATFNLQTTVLRVEQVPGISVADAKVIPDSGLVIIREAAKMDKLTNAVILADTTQFSHKIIKASVDIISKESLQGYGEYLYSTANAKNQVIEFTDLGTIRVTTGEKRDKKEGFQLYGKGLIEENKKFYVYQGLGFNGDVKLTSVNPNLNFEGYVKPELKNAKAPWSAFSIKSDVNPKDLLIDVSGSKDLNGSPLFTGLYFNSGEQPGLYPALLYPRQNPADPAIMEAKGVLVHNPVSGVWSFGDEKKLRKAALVGNVMSYDDSKSLIKGEGKLPLGLKFGQIKHAAAGDFEHDLNSGKTTLNLTLALDINLDKTAFQKFGALMSSDNFDNSDLTYEGERFKKQIRELIPEEKEKRFYEDLSTTGAFKRNNALEHKLILTDLNLVYDTSDASFRSTGKIGVCFVGDQAIHKKVDGWLEMGLLPGKDYFNLYFKMGTGEWFYFEYKFNTLTVLSSYDDFNGLITVVPQDKRVVKTDKDAYYVYGPASSADKQLFTDAMKARAAGTAVESRRERYSTPPARPGARIPGMPSAVPIPVEPGYNPEPAVDQIPTDGAVPADSGSAEPQPVVPAEPPRRESSRDRIYRQKAAEQGGGGASDSAPVEQNAAPSEVPATPVQTPPAESQPPVTTPEGNANPDPVQPPATPVQTPPTESQPPVTTPEGNANPDPVQPPVAPVKTPPAESQPPAAPPVTSPEGNSSPATPESSQGTEQQSNDSASQSPAGDDNSGSGKRKKGKGKNQDSAPE